VGGFSLVVRLVAFWWLLLMLLVISGCSYWFRGSLVFRAGVLGFESLAELGASSFFCFSSSLFDGLGLSSVDKLSGLRGWLLLLLSVDSGWCLYLLSGLLVFSGVGGS
jgi:hypothetical protein